MQRAEGGGAAVGEVGGGSFWLEVVHDGERWVMACEEEATRDAWMEAVGRSLRENG